MKEQTAKAHHLSSSRKVGDHGQHDLMLAKEVEIVHPLDHFSHREEILSFAR